jgi:deoxyribodipyrimidine photo-lyase
MSTLVWFRTDLRVHDHEPLQRAAAAGPVVAVYCIDERQHGRSALGLPRMAASRARFLVESIAALREDLRACGGDLIVRRGPPEEILPALAAQVGADALYFHRGVGTEERAVEDALARTPLRLHAFDGDALLHPDDLPFSLRELPDLFTRFRTWVEKEGVQPRPTVPEIRALAVPAVEPGPLPGVADFGLVEEPADPRATGRFAGGTTAGRARLRHYVWDADRLRTYKQTRNGMLGPDDSSRLSPWLALGCLSPREVYEEVQRYERERVRNESTYWLIFELLWRDYFHFVARKYGARLFRVGGLRDLRLPWRRPDRDAAAQRDFAAWCDGRTGYPLVDANMRELRATGFMSNRGRQNVASFLTKNLAVDWRFGAAWFEAHLLDYDPASNYGNWCYTAGVGNDARQFRFFNIYKQAEEYDPHGDYVRHWLPELRGLHGVRAHRPDQLTPDERRRAGVDYPPPLVDLFESARANERKFGK